MGWRGIDPTIWPTKGPSMFNLLVDPLIGVLDVEGQPRHVSLPQLFFALGVDGIATFPALRPHQRHAWHALLCQLGALGCLKSGLSAPPKDSDGWRATLRALTHEFPGDEPWMLVTSPDKPAFLQAVVGALDSFKPLSTPDELDMLVTAKNHDLKGARLSSAEANDWLFALVTLQTMEGFLGAGNYGISRMNGGFANRPGFSVSPPGCIGAHVMRDLKRLIAIRDDVLEKNAVFDPDGLALVWLRSWNGASSLQPTELDPNFIEICRRVRLIYHDGRISALAAGSKVARITFSKDARGLTGDPWTPIEIKDGELKALTVDARGFSYKRMSVSPPARGWSPHQHVRIGVDKGFPARAGMVPESACRLFPRRWFPRPRGDGPAPAVALFPHDPVSPPARGWSPHGAPARPDGRGARRRQRADGQPHHRSTGGRGGGGLSRSDLWLHRLCAEWQRRQRRGPGNKPAAAARHLHGPTLQGVGDVPAIAGRHPNYIVRQLWNIQNGDRGGASAALMKAVVEKLNTLGGATLEPV
jgi:hypothetical protein